MSIQNNVAIQQQEIKDISSMLMPLQQDMLLLPGISVAEIVGFVPASQEESDAPEWFLGNIQWRNLSVPLVSFESLKGQSLPNISSHCRIAVLNNTGLNHQLDFFAIVIQATPRLLRVLPSDVVEQDDISIEAGEKLHVKVQGEMAMIPDTAFIERSIINFLELT